jgi:glycosyltransferase involved in cell wall biosynthesis
MISVIMPVYNNLEFLKESIDSVLGQTYEDFEFIILDDGSTEPVWDFLDQYSDSRIVKIRNKENIGLTKSLNICLDKVMGDFIARHDSDDISLPTRFEEEIRCFVDGVGLVSTYAKTVDKNGKDVSCRYCEVDSRKKGSDIKKGNYVIGSSAIFSRKVFDTIGYYDEKLYIAQDYNYWIRLLKHFGHIVVDKVLCVLRRHAGSVRTRHVEFRHFNWNKLCNERADEYPTIKKRGDV